MSLSKLRKKSRVGGSRKRVPNKYREQALIDNLYQIHGGPLKVSKRLKATLCVVLNWRNRGSISRPAVPLAAKVFSVSKGLLNVKALAVDEQEKFNWEKNLKAVKQLKPAVKAQILKLPSRFD